MDQRVADQYRKTLNTYLASCLTAFGDVGQGQGSAPHLREYLVASTANGLQLLAASVAKAVGDVSHARNLETRLEDFVKDSHRRLQEFRSPRDKK